VKKFGNHWTMFWTVGVRLPAEQILFFSPQHPERFSLPLSFLSNGQKLRLGPKGVKELKA
jgi:hypothetical protein